MFSKAVILRDSKAAIHAHPKSDMYLTKEYCKIIFQLQNIGKQIVLQWIPSHCDISGNESIDYCKEGIMHFTTHHPQIHFKIVLPSTFQPP